MGHFYMENICTMDEQRKCELKIIAGKIGWILLIAYLGSLILMRIMPIFAENMAFYIFWAGIVWMGMKKWGRLSLLDTCYSKNKYELSVLEKGLLTAFVIFLSHVFCAFFLFLYAKVFQDIVMMNDKSLHSGLDIFTGVILGPLVEEWIFRGILWSKLKSYGEGFAILATTILFAIMHGQGLLLIFLLIGFFSGVLVCLTGNLWYAIIFHVIHNMGIFLWENKLFSFSMNMVLTMLLNAGLFLMLLILLLLCSKKNILLHLYYCKKKLLEKIISEKSRLVVFFTTAGIMSFVLYFGVSWLISLVSFGLNL